MNDHSHDLARDEEALLGHVRTYHREQPSSTLDARILAAAVEAAVPRKPETQGAWQRLLGWLAGASGRGRWSAAFGCVAVLGLGLGLGLKTLEQAPPADDMAPAPMALQALPSPAEHSVLAHAEQAPKIVARMAARTPPLPDEVLNALREIAELRARGEGEQAQRRVERLAAQHPGLDVEAEVRNVTHP
ncbi:hypothetical protein SAMN05216588_104141 [Pseudomonas flavescens]|uniref:Uncharacterized protein n=1 Tax=Phytopseudomonas flavescens TaxID=29435 RepID=A0A1G8BSP3_9GAMM|nr:hypothetical protein [Pseudomonas flavescens]SDH36118.1 hypothetical protein SAMN05216588_104141 [Pseudomonas flavescens]